MNQAVMNQPGSNQASRELGQPIKNYAEFYKFYLSEHGHVMSRRLHAIGSVAGLYGIYKTVSTGKKRYIVRGIVTGYACAWVGHFFFEKNKPASFKQPLYSFISDWRMLGDICRGRLSLRHRKYDCLDK